MPVTYSDAHSVRFIAHRLISENHPHLIDVRIEYVFRSEASKSGGRAVWGKARRLSGLNAYLATPEDERPRPDGDGHIDEVEPFFIIEIAEDVWGLISPPQRDALVDHELSHCRIEHTETGPKLVLATHDVEEFEEVLRRHGLWRSDLSSFAKVASEFVHEQQELFDAGDDEAE